MNTITWSGFAAPDPCAVPPGRVTLPFKAVADNPITVTASFTITGAQFSGEASTTDTTRDFEVKTEDKDELKPVFLIVNPGSGLVTVDMEMGIFGRASWRINPKVQATALSLAPPLGKTLRKKASKKTSKKKTTGTKLNKREPARGEP